MWVIFERKIDGSHGEEETKGSYIKVFRYLPIIPSFKQLWIIKDDEKNLSWHTNGRKCNNLLWHLADSPYWKEINETFTEFGVKSRNLRLKLVTNDMNP